MAGERINLATLDIDVQGLIKAAQTSSQALMALRAEQAELRKSGEEGSPQFIRNEVEIRNLSVAYRAQTTAIQAQVSEGGKLVNQQDAINEAVGRLNLSENEYRANNTLLLKQRKDLKTTDEDYQKNLDAINKKLNENNEWIKENVSDYEKQKIGIGNYSQGIKDAISETGIFNGTLGAFSAEGDIAMSVFKLFSPVLDDLKKRFTDITKEMGIFKKAQDASTVATEAQAAAQTTAAVEADVLAASMATVVATEAAAVVETGSLTASEGTLTTAEAGLTTTTVALTGSMTALAGAEAVVIGETTILTGETAALATVQTVQAGASTTAAGATNILSGALGILKLVLDALGIGLIIAAVVLIVAAFSKFTPLIDKVEQGMAAVGAVFKVVLNAIIALVTGAKSLGEIFSSLGDDMDEAADSAVKLKKAQQDLEDAMAQQEVQSARNRAEINRLNVQAKDRTKSEEERLALLQKASDLEDKDFNQRKKNADESLRQAQEQIRIDAELNDAEFAQLKKRGLDYKEFIEERTGGVDELFEKLKDAQLKEIDLDNEYYTNQEKNINKQNKLIEDKEKADADALKAKEKRQADAVKAEADRQAKIQKALDDYSESLKLQLDLFRQIQGEKARSIDEEIANAQRVKEQQDKIAKAEYDASKKTANDKLKLQAAYNDNAKELLDSQTSAIVKNADIELEHIMAVNKSKLDSNKFLSDEILQQELARLDRIAEAERDNATIKLEAAKASQQEINDAIATIDAESQVKKNELEQQRKEAKRGADLADLENKRILDGEAFQIDLASRMQEYEITRAAEREDAVKRGLDLVAFDAVTAKQRKDIEKDVFLNKLSLAENTYNGIASLLGKATTAGKITAIAQTTIDTYQAATAAFKALAGIPIVGPALGAAAAAGAVGMGLANVKKITSTSVPKAEKGGLFGIGGKRHSAGGTLFTGADGTQFEAERGELIGVMSRNAAAHFMAFNNAFNGGSVSPTNYLASGGIVSRDTTTSINIKELAYEIGNATAAANASLPNPVVSVVDIMDVGNNYVGVKDNGNF